MEIRTVTDDRLAEAMELCGRVFSEFEAPDYPQEGVEAFFRYIEDANQIRVMTVFGAFDADTLVGVLALQGTHIALFFVEGSCHHRGIGRALFQTFVAAASPRHLSVHAAPHAVGFYRRLGFVAVTDEQHSPDGIRYVPMEYGFGL